MPETKEFIEAAEAISKLIADARSINLLKKSPVESYGREKEPKQESQMIYGRMSEPSAVLVW